MARTKEQILEELTFNAPQWFIDWSMTIALLRAAARVYAFLEATSETLLELVFRQTSSGQFLDDIGEEHSLERLPGETDDVYRARITLRSQGVTPNALRSEIALIVDHYLGDGFEVKLFEPYQVFSDDTAFSDDVETITPPGAGEERPKFLFWLSFPRFPTLNAAGTAFADLSFADLSFAGDDDRDARHRFLNTTLIQWIESHRTASVAFGVTINDTVEESMFDLLFDSGHFFAI